MTIVLTLDYELFLNDKTGTVGNCLEVPMSKLQEVCDKHNVRYTVFVDAAYLLRLNQLKSSNNELNEDYIRVCNNIKWIHSKGNDIELHIHPQWFFSNYIKGEWILDWEHYSLADVGGEQAINYFKESKGLLDSILGEKTIVFRAGGYTLQGFDYYKAFQDVEIIADSSVLPMQKEITSTHRFDYKGVPLTPYSFTENVCKPTRAGVFKELPISVSSKVFLPNYLSTKRKFMSLTNNVNWGDGGDYVATGAQDRIKRIVKAFTLFKQPKATIDYQSFFFLEKVYKESLKRGYLNIIGHPKNFSPASLQYFDDFVGDCLKKGDVFVTAKELCAN